MPAERRYSLIVFDWDGTLIDSAATIVECIQAAAREMALPVPDEARARHVIGLGLNDSLRHAVPMLPRGQYADFAERYRQQFLAREDALQLFPGVRALLERLARRGHRLALATGKSRRGLDRALGASGLGEYFAASRCGDETHPKPHPAMLLELLRELGAQAPAALMVGDTSHDLQMARSAGVDALGVTYGAHSAAELRGLAPLECLASVEELARWLETNA
ncbi:MAG: HAD family hydrolase [Betaproteobacteria bacterium]|nr:MAG: HAD family hydrolase [Betaproteobacteria bacterium]